MKKTILLFVLAVFPFCGKSAFAQTSGANKVVNYKTVTDEPYGINKMWLHFQPITADVFMTNFNLGFGTQFNYFITDKITFEARYNGPYSNRLDFSRDLAIKNAQVMWGEEKLKIENKFTRYNNLQFGGGYHIIDNETKGVSKIMLTSKKLKAMQNTNIDKVIVNSKVRHIIGVRGGAFFFTSTMNLGSAMIKQGNKVLTGSDGSTLEPSINNKLYTNVISPGFYLGGTFGRIRNVAIKADKFGMLGNNTIFSSYADIMYSPFLSVEDIVVKQENTTNKVTYSTGNINLNRFGWRAGFDIMYNNDTYFAFGGEIGARPTVAKRGTYVLVKVGFPVFSFRPRPARTANNTGSL